jgi:hypothetical protein
MHILKKIPVLISKIPFDFYYSLLSNNTFFFKLIVWIRICYKLEYNRSILSKMAVVVIFLTSAEKST